MVPFFPYLYSRRRSWRSNLGGIPPKKSSQATLKGSMGKRKLKQLPQLKLILIQSPVIQDMAWKPFLHIIYFKKSLHKYFSLQFETRFLHNRISNCWFSSYVFWPYFRGLEIGQSWIRKTCNLHRKWENTGKAWDMWRSELLSWRWISWTAQRKKDNTYRGSKIMWKRLKITVSGN